jgi:hypothetical protein
MLVDHAESEADGVRRTRDPHRSAVHLDAAGVRRHEAVEDAHQRGLAGAILAHQRVDLAGCEFERHAIVGDDAAESACDVAQCHERCDHGGARVADRTVWTGRPGSDTM